ncbi:MAG: glycosyltransferase [Desulfonatronovibrionaceae bacterium]
MLGESRKYELREKRAENGEVIDVRIRTGEQSFDLVGPYGSKRLEKELEGIRRESPDCLLVLVGAGTGEYLRRVRHTWNGLVAVVDKEVYLAGVSGAGSELECGEFFWIGEKDARAAVNLLTRWQMENQARQLRAVHLPAYMRLDPEYYRFVYNALRAGHRFDFWAKTRYPRFKEDLPRILLVTSQYFLMGEMQAACTRMGVPHHFLHLPDQELGRQEYVQGLLQAVLEFKPDFVLTINHLGVDKEGVLLDLLEKMRLPLASWFVDNPHLILYLYENLNSPWTSIFTWDRDNLPTLRDRGFENLTFLPLATDSQRFASMNGRINPENDLAFVGNSMVHKVRSKFRDSVLTPSLKETYSRVAGKFNSSDELSVGKCLKDNFPELWADFKAIADVEDRLRYETMVTWEATRVYRAGCVRYLLDFHPVIAGDNGWLEILPDTDCWTWQSELNYYTELPFFYPQNRINFNCTSAQMKGAVNQRVFDVPVSGSFLLTDYRRQMEELFDLDREAVCFVDPEEIPDLVRYYLNHPEKREKIVRAARRRILSEHTYEIRLQKLMQTMQQLYA